MKKSECYLSHARWQLKGKISLKIKIKLFYMQNKYILLLKEINFLYRKSLYCELLNFSFRKKDSLLFLWFSLPSVWRAVLPRTGCSPYCCYCVQLLFNFSGRKVKLRIITVTYKDKKQHRQKFWMKFAVIVDWNAPKLQKLA